MAESIFICLGNPPVAGCGRILADEERHWYGHSCEACSSKWGDPMTRN